MMAGCWQRAVRAVAAIGAASLLGCASDLVAFGEGANAGYRHRWRGYEIGRPASPAGQAWERFQVEGIDLAFRLRSGEEAAARVSTMSLRSECRPTLADVSILAGQLRLGLSEPTLLESGPTSVDGSPAWQQVLETGDRDLRSRIKTVTALERSCTFDWVLVARGSFEPLERSFDSWWGSFRFLEPGRSFFSALGLP